jgi:hypothetical protein
MQGRFLLWGFFLLICLECCAVTDLREDQAKSLEVSEIKALLGKYESAWNQHNQQSLLALLHDEFVIFSGSGRRIAYTKKRYAFDLSHIMRRNRYLMFAEPAIWTKGDKATVVVHMIVDGRRIRNTFHMIRENDRWFILDSEF